MKSTRANKMYVSFWGLVTIAFWVWARNGGEDQEFRGLWQVWHPWTLAAVGIFVIIPVLPFVVKTIKSFGSHKSNVGRALIFLALGVFCWLVLGTGSAYWYLTCEHWGPLSCSAGEGGNLPVPSWGDVFTGMLFPLWMAALFNLSKLMAIDAKDLRRLGIIPLGIFILNAFMALPFGAGIVIDSWDFTQKAAIALYFVLGDAAITSFTILLLIGSRRIAGGLFTKPMATVLVGLILLLIGDTLFSSHFTTGEFKIGDASTLFFGMSLICMMFSILQFGAVADQLQGSGGD